MNTIRLFLCDRKFNINSITSKNKSNITPRENTFFVYGNNIVQLHTKAFEVDDNLKETNHLRQKQCGHQNRDVSILVTVLKINKNMRKTIKEDTQLKKKQ